MTETAIELARRLHTADRDEVKQQALRALDDLAGLAERISRDVATDSKVRWWAQHGQGLSHDAGKIERLLNQLITWDQAIMALGNAEQYAAEGN